MDAAHSLVDHSGPPTVSPCGESDLHDIFRPANRYCRKHWKDRLRMIKQYEVPSRLPTRSSRDIILSSSDIPSILLSCCSIPSISQHDLDLGSPGIAIDSVIAVI
jgi:hypothetical protein